MDVAITFAVIIVIITICMFIGALIADEIRDRKARKRQPTCIVYLLRVDESGKVEIKRSPKNDMWNWKF